MAKPRKNSRSSLPTSDAWITEKKKKETDQNTQSFRMIVIPREHHPSEGGRKGPEELIQCEKGTPGITKQLSDSAPPALVGGQQIHGEQVAAAEPPDNRSGATDLCCLGHRAPLPAAFS